MPGPPEREPIGLQLAKTAREVGKAFDAALARAGGSLPTWLILISIKSRRHGAQREIAQAVGIEGATLTHHLNRMERDGLVTRSRDPENRRAHQVEITEEGDKAFFAMLVEAQAFDAQLRTGVSASDLDALERLFGQLRHNVTRPGNDITAPKASERRPT